MLYIPLSPQLQAIAYELSMKKEQAKLQQQVQDAVDNIHKLEVQLQFAKKGQWDKIDKEALDGIMLSIQAEQNEAWTRDFTYWLQGIISDNAWKNARKQAESAKYLQFQIKIKLNDQIEAYTAATVKLMHNKAALESFEAGLEAQKAMEEQVQGPNGTEQ